MQFFIDITLSIIYLCLFLLLCAWTWRFWKMYINQKHLDSIQWLMLEIKLPREIMKSPLAMEVALASLAQGGGVGTWYNRHFQGNLVAYSSLEIASLEGTIHFYVRIQKKFKSLVEANLYAQYPGIEITEAQDYTSLIHYHHLSNDVSVWGATYPLSRKWEPNKDDGDPYKDEKSKKNYEMPADFLPIKTYVDYGLDKDPKEEFKTDPITPLLEFLGSLGKGEYGWYQILVQDAGKFDDKNFPKTYLNKQSHDHMTLADMANARKKQIRTAGYVKPNSVAYNEYGEKKFKPSGEKDADGKDIMVEQKYIFKDAKATPKSEQALTAEEKEEIEMINRKLSKPVLRAVIRMVYVAKRTSFRFENVQNILAIMRPFNHTSKTGNSFGLSPSDPYDYSWEDTMGRRKPWRSEEMFEAYVEREGFFPHVESRDALDKFEDLFFWSYSAKMRKVFRMIVEAIFYPFDHPTADVISLNTEELATLWHLPGTVAGTPTLPRIDSTKGMAPSNLPQ